MLAQPSDRDPSPPTTREDRTVPLTPQLTIPLEAAHVRRALADGRRDQEGLRTGERDWLEQHAPHIGLRMREVFTHVVTTKGLSCGEAVFIGSMMGHRAVRYCVSESSIDNAAEVDTYKAGVKNFLRNDVDLPPVAGQVDVSLASVEALTFVFDDPLVVGAFLDIKDDYARNAAARMVAYFCFEHMPRPSL